jgi:GT2 family glycosyltransferase
MSFRRGVLERFSFDESLVGYCMREDLDISYRVAKEFKILYLPTSSLSHMESPLQRPSALRFGEMDVKSWGWFVRKNMPGFLNRICFSWGVLGYVLILLLSGLLNWRRTDFLRAIGGFKALVLEGY